MMLYGRLDVDDVGDKLELLLLQDDIAGAVELQNHVREGMQWLTGALARQLRAEILFVGCDDIFFSAVGDGEALSIVISDLARKFFERTTCTYSCGIAADRSSALHNLRLAKLKGKNKIERSGAPAISGTAG